MKKYVFTVLMTCLVIQIFAQTATAPSLGDGTEGDPYQIATLENLYWIAADTTNWDKHYIQTADIDASETVSWFTGNGWLPIGLDYNNYFSGSYDGKGYTIGNLFISRIEEDEVGLFKWVRFAVLKNINLSKVNITGKDKVGGIVGEFGESSNLTSCNSSGDINGSSQVGGLVGNSFGSVLLKCHNSSNVAGIYNVGGLVGSDNLVSLVQCYNTGNISGTGGVGGLVGSQSGADAADIYNCFNIGNISGTDCVGGLYGNCYDTDSYNCFSIGIVQGTSNTGGLAGELQGVADMFLCFWDTETSDQTTSAGGTGLTTAEMKTKQTFLDAGWDFVGETENGTEDIWVMDGVTNDGYPFLNWMPHPIATAPSAGDGSEGNPYQIATLENLYWIAADTLNLDKFYIQTADIDASETRNWFVCDHDNDPETPDEPKGWKTIGGFSEVEALGYFSGSYDGQNHTIDGIYINEITTSFSYSNTAVGLFGNTQNAVLKNIGLTNVDITGIDAGALTGLTYIDTIENCYATGKVFGSWCTGGLIGEGAGSSLFNCRNSASVTGQNNVGGLIGSNNMVSLDQCYNTGNISGTGGVGGLVGSQSGAEPTRIYNCFNTGNITGTEKVGGLYGQCFDTNSYYCFSTGTVTGATETGGMVGKLSGADLYFSFWDTETSGQTTSAAGTGLTTAEMKTKQTFLDAGWDFVGESTNGTEDIWDMDGVTNDGYPFLAWMTTTGIDDAEDSLLPEKITLFQNYPNPFNPVTTIKFALPGTADIRLSVYNSNGQLVEELINSKYQAGSHSVMFNGERLNSGLYFYRLDTKGKSIVKKMLLIK